MISIMSFNARSSQKDNCLHEEFSNFSWNTIQCILEEYCKIKESCCEGYTKPFHSGTTKFSCVGPSSCEESIIKMFQIVFCKIITEDELWFSRYDSETDQWLSLSKKKKVHQLKSNVNLNLVYFSDVHTQDSSLQPNRSSRILFTKKAKQEHISLYTID